MDDPLRAAVTVTLSREDAERLVSLVYGGSGEHRTRVSGILRVALAAPAPETAEATCSVDGNTVTIAVRARETTADAVRAAERERCAQVCEERERNHVRERDRAWTEKKRDQSDRWAALADEACECTAAIRAVDGSPAKNERDEARAEAMALRTQVAAMRAWCVSTCAAYTGPQWTGCKWSARDMALHITAVLQNSPYAPDAPAVRDCNLPAVEGETHVITPPTTLAALDPVAEATTDVVRLRAYEALMLDIRSAMIAWHGSPETHAMDTCIAIDDALRVWRDRIPENGHLLQPWIGKPRASENQPPPKVAWDTYTHDAQGKAWDHRGNDVDLRVSHSPSNDYDRSDEYLWAITHIRVEDRVKTKTSMSGCEYTLKDAMDSSVKALPTLLVKIP